MDTGKRIKKVRQILNKSQQDLANEMSVTKQAISNIETGKCAAGLNLLRKLLVDYGVNLNYLIGGIGNMFVADEEIKPSLKKEILKEVENMLAERGIN